MTPEENHKLALKVLYDDLKEHFDACHEDGEAMARMLQNAPDVLGFTGMVNSLQELVFLRKQVHRLDYAVGALTPEHVCIAVHALKSFLAARQNASSTMLPDSPAPQDGGADRSREAGDGK